MSNGKYIILVIENGPTDTGKSGFRWNYRGRQVVQNLGLKRKIDKMEKDNYKKTKAFTRDIVRI